MSLVAADPAERHRRIAGTFSDRVRGTIDWSAPAPVDGWTARDVVGHLVEWFPGFLAMGSDVRLPTGPAVDEEYAFRGCFHTVSPTKIVQTFTWEGMPDGVSLETVRFEDLGGGRTRLVAESLCDSFEGRDGWLASGMEVGVNDGYAKLDALIADGAV